MKLNELIQLKNGIHTFIKGKDINVAKIKLSDFLSKLQDHITHGEERESAQINSKKLQRIPYLRDAVLNQYIDTLAHIENEIQKGLVEYPNFEGIEFCDVSVGGINIRGFHKQIEGYSYGGQPKINHDFSNVEEVVEQFIEMWKNCDNEKAVSSKQRFIKSGETYGWD